MSWWPWRVHPGLDRLGGGVLGRVVVPGDDLAGAVPGQARVADPVEDVLAVRLGVAHDVVDGHDLRARPGDRHQVRVLADEHEAGCRALAVGQRDEVELGLGQGRSGDRVGRAAVDDRFGHGGSGQRHEQQSGEEDGDEAAGRGEHGTIVAASLASRNGSGVTVHMPRSYGLRTALRLTELHRVRTARTGRPPKGCGTMGRTTPDHTKLEGGTRWQPSDEPRPPGPAP